MIIGIGEILWDLLPTGKKAGGAPVNFAFHAAASGVESYAISAVGDDPEGDQMMRELQHNGIRYLIERVAYPTGTVQVELNNGIPSYTIT
ncbi:MAG: PfkB family carbohydrate kinase, partial [Proteiniphilum sp.]